MPAKKTLALSEQFARRPGKGCQDAQLSTSGLLNEPPIFCCTLGHPCSSISATVTSLKRRLTKSSPPCRSHSVFLRCHGHILRLRHAVLNLHLETSVCDLLLPPELWKFRKVVSLRDRQTRGPAKKKAHTSTRLKL